MLRWLIRIGLVLALAPAVYFGLGGLLVAGAMWWAFTPGAVDWSGAASPSDDPYDLTYHGDPQAALSLPFETVSVDTVLGPAEAWLIRPQGPPRHDAWAVYVHGIGGTRENGYRVLTALREAGLPTLLISYRNDPAAPPSTEHLFAFGLSEWPDLEAAVDWVVAHGAGRVVLAAESLGGGIAGQFLARSDRGRHVAALVLEAPALDLGAAISAALAELGVPMADTVRAVALALTDAILPVRFSAAVAYSAIRDFDRPLLLIHGGGDRIVPVAISDRLAGERAAPTAYLRTGADHLKSWHEDGARYQRELRVFLDAVLAGPVPPTPPSVVPPS